MAPTEERAQLVAPMELIGKAIEQLNDLFKETNYIVYENSVRTLSGRLELLQAHDTYLGAQNNETT